MSKGPKKSSQKAKKRQRRRQRKLKNQDRLGWQRPSRCHCQPTQIRCFDQARRIALRAVENGSCAFYRNGLPFADKDPELIIQPQGQLTNEQLAILDNAAKDSDGTPWLNSDECRAFDLAAELTEQPEPENKDTDQGVVPGGNP